MDGSSDPCSKGEDINFQFQGLTLSGAVVSSGAVTGPEGVVVRLGKDGQEVSFFVFIIKIDKWLPASCLASLL